MKTLVELRINKKVTSKIIKEVRELSRANTSNHRGIVVKEDTIDDRLLLITFESYRGRQMDLADPIMKSYSHFLDCYSDIAVQFETRRNTVSIEKEMTLASRKEVIDLIERYFYSIDKQDWKLLSECLDDRLDLLPKPPIRSSRQGVKASAFISHLEKILSGITITHETDDFTTRRYGDVIECQCQVAIKGAIKIPRDDFTAMGNYNFSIARWIDDKLKIIKIERVIEEMEGSEKASKLYIP